MNYPSKQVKNYRIFVGGFDQVRKEYTKARIERVSFPPLGFPTRLAFDSRMRREIEVCLFAMDLETYEVVPMFLVPNKLVSSCLFQVKITIEQFENY
jgi:hypothetical protein